jgi:hypothetical protein
MNKIDWKSPQTWALFGKLLAAVAVVTGVVSVSDATSLAGAIGNAVVGIVALRGCLAAVLHFNGLHLPAVADVTAASAAVNTTEATPTSMHAAPGSPP